MVSTSGSKLITDEAIEAVREMLFPLATLITPNIEEVRVLTGISVKSVDDMQRAAEALLDCGCNAVLMKGGHLDGDESVDMLFEKGKDGIGIRSAFVDTKNTHGTGCTLSSAFAAALARGEDLTSAAISAKKYIEQAIISGAEYEIGHGHGPVNHFFL